MFNCFYKDNLFILIAKIILNKNMLKFVKTKC